MELVIFGLLAALIVLLAMPVIGHVLSGSTSTSATMDRNLDPVETGNRTW